MNTDVMFSSVKDDWETPQEFFNKLNQEFNFTLDPCANDKNHKCTRYFYKRTKWACAIVEQRNCIL